MATVSSSNTPMMALILLCLAFSFTSSFATIIRGVELKHQPLYDPAKGFTCLDGSQTIPFDSVNDNYCDCADGSDEPGTSACPDGKFYCENIGYKGFYIPSSRINDGICDCCDGSDEHDSSVVCFNECQKFGQEALEQRKKELEEANAGYESKQEYIRQGKDKKAEKKTRLDTINGILEERRAKLEELRAIKEAVEAPEKEAKDKHQKEWDESQAKLKEQQDIIERGESFSLLDIDKNGWLTIAELMSNQHLDADVTENDAKDLLGGEAMVDADAYAAVWPSMKPKFLKSGRPEPETPAEESSKDETSQEGGDADAKSAEETPIAEPPIKSSEGESDSQHGADNLEFDSQHDPDKLAEQISSEEYKKLSEDEKERLLGQLDEDSDNDDVDDNDDDDSDEDSDSGTPRDGDYLKPKDANMPDYDDATKQLIEAAEEARRKFDEVDREVRELDTEHKSIEEFMNTDFGADEQFNSLKGQCFEITDREYTYKLCPFEKVTQRPKDGGSETDLGTWGKWDGEEASRHSKMKYEGGQSCWNGPARSTVVKLSCGKENEVVSVSEPSRCEYEMAFKTPSICEKVEHLVHTEL